MSGKHFKHMRNIAFIILFLCIRMDTHCQSLYESWYKDKPDGVHKEYYKNDSLSVLLVKKDGFIETFNGYYPNGQTYFEHYYKNGKATGVHTGYTDDNRLLNLYKFKNDTLIYCECINYFDLKLFSNKNTNTVSKRSIWEFSGENIRYLKEKDKVVGDIAVNICVSYGKHTYYYPNGNIKKQGSKINGRKFGKWEYYDEKGNLLKSKIH